MASRKHGKLSGVERYAQLDLPTFERISKDIVDAYNKGYVNFILAGPQLSITLSDTIEEMLRKKNDVDEETFEQAVETLLFSMHWILSEEEIGILQGMKDKKLAHQAEKKLDFVREILVKDPGIKNSFLTHTFSLSAILLRLDWEAKFKHAQSIEYGKVFEPYAMGRIRLVLSTVGVRPTEFVNKFIDFDVSLKDVDIMIKSLTELKEALERLRDKKIA